MLSILWNKHNIVSVTNKFDQKTKSCDGDSLKIYYKDGLMCQRYDRSRLDVLSTDDMNVLLTGYIRCNISQSMNPNDIASITSIYISSNNLRNNMYDCKHVRITFHKPPTIIHYNYDIKRDNPNSYSCSSKTNSNGLSSSLILIKLKRDNKIPKITIKLINIDCDEDIYKHDGYNFKIGFIQVLLNINYDAQLPHDNHHDNDHNHTHDDDSVTTIPDAARKHKIPLQKIDTCTDTDTNTDTCNMSGHDWNSRPVTKDINIYPSDENCDVDKLKLLQKKHQLIQEFENEIENMAGSFCNVSSLDNYFSYNCNEKFKYRNNCDHDHDHDNNSYNYKSKTDRYQKRSTIFLTRFHYHNYCFDKVNRFYFNIRPMKHFDSIRCSIHKQNTRNSVTVDYDKYGIQYTNKEYLQCDNQLRSKLLKFGLMEGESITIDRVPIDKSFFATKTDIHNKQNKKFRTKICSLAAVDVCKKKTHVCQLPVLDIQPNCNQQSYFFIECMNCSCVGKKGFDFEIELT